MKIMNMRCGPCGLSSNVVVFVEPISVSSDQITAAWLLKSTTLTTDDGSFTGVALQGEDSPVGELGLVLVTSQDREQRC